MEAKALAPEPISSYSVLLSPCLPSLFAAHLRQIHPFVCQAVCFESFSACYWFSSPRLFLVLFYFFYLHQILIWFFHIFFFSSLSYYFSSTSHSYCLFGHISLFYIILFTCSIHFQALFFFNGKCCGWRSAVCRLCSVSVCMCVLGKRHAFNFVAVFHMIKCKLFF